MQKNNKKIFLYKSTLVVFVFCISNFSFAKAACDCGSTDSANPCTGQSISVTVKAGTPNGGTAMDSVYNWSFNSGGGNARCGQFANGDYWVAPANGQTTVTINSITTTSPGEISADADPQMESMGLLSSTKTYGNYNADENIIPNLPLSYGEITSLVAAIQRNEAVEGGCGTSAIVGNCANSYNVVTILEAIPENAGATVIRPNITGQTKEILTFSDFDFTRLPAKDFLSGTSADGYETIRSRWSHSTEIFGLMNAFGAGYSEGGRAFRAHSLIDDYGAGVASTWNDNMMILFSGENVFEEKRAALAAMLSYGLDLYHGVNDRPAGINRYWGQGATQSPGKFMPAVFLSALLVDETKANLLKTVGPNVNSIMDDLGPHEMGQVHQGKFRPVWGDFTNYGGSYYLGSYWGNVLKSQCYDGATGTCDTGIGKKTQLDPHGYIDGPPNKPGTNYISSSLGVQRSFMASMCLMPEIYDIINYPKLVTYVNRISTYGLKTADDPCVTPDSRENLETCDAYRNTGCLYYGVTWGPVDINNVNSECITTPTPPYNKVGRFTELDGNPVSVGYTTWQVENNWEKIISENPLCKQGIENIFRADVDGSSEITTTDALLTLRNSLGLSMTGTAWQASITTGDVNCDGISNSTDALLILRYSLGLSMSETGWCE